MDALQEKEERLRMMEAIERGRRRAHVARYRRVEQPFRVHPGWTKALPTLPPRYKGWCPNPAYLNFISELCGVPNRVTGEDYLQSWQVHPIEIALNLPLTPYNGSYDATCNRLEYILRSRRMIA